MTLLVASTRRHFLHLASVAALAPGTLLPAEKRHTSPPAPPLAPFPDVAYQGALPAPLQSLPVYTDADVNDLLRAGNEDPMGLPGSVSQEQADFTLTSLLRLVPRMLLTSARGTQTKRPVQIILSPYGNGQVLGTGIVQQYQRDGSNNIPALESRLEVMLGQGNRARMAYTQRPMATAMMARQDPNTTLLAYTGTGTLSDPDGALVVRVTTQDGAPAYIWTNNLSGMYAAPSTSTVAPGPWHEHALTATPWFRLGDYSAIELLHKVLRAQLWNGEVHLHKNYDTVSVLTRTAGEYQNGGIDFELHSYAVDWVGGKPTFLPGEAVANLHLTYAQDGPGAGTLQQLVLTVDRNTTTFTEAVGVGAIPLLNPAASERYSVTNPTMVWAIYNDPREPTGTQATATANMPAIVKGLKGNGAAALGTIPYTGR